MLHLYDPHFLGSELSYILQQLWMPLVFWYIHSTFPFPLDVQFSFLMIDIFFSFGFHCISSEAYISCEFMHVT